MRIIKRRDFYKIIINFIIGFLFGNLCIKNKWWYKKFYFEKCFKEAMFYEVK